MRSREELSDLPLRKVYTTAIFVFKKIQGLYNIETDA